MASIASCSFTSDVQLVTSHTEPVVKPKPRAPILPPCRICGVKASGLHYGVNSCEACKGFFRRSMFNKEKYVCAKVQKCEIVPGKRGHCAYCRYQKCLRLGMSVQAIRTGRYTHQKKANDIIEVKTIEGRKKNALNEEEISTLINTLQDGVKDTDMISILSTPFTELKDKHTWKLVMEEIGVSEGSLAWMLDDLYSAEASDKSRYIRAAVEKWSFGSRKRLFLIITLAMSIPGFSALPVPDQIALVKASRAEAITVMVHKRLDYVGSMFYATHTNHLSPKSELVMIYDDEEMVSRMFTVARDFQALNLTTSEMLLVLGIIITFADRVDLEAREAVEKMQNRLVSALKDCVEMNHPEERHLLARILVSLVSLRELTLRSNKALPNIQKDWSTQAGFDPLWEKFIRDSHSWYQKHI